MQRVARHLLLLFSALFASSADATLADCEHLYVGRIWVEKGVGLYAVVLLESPAAASGSNWMYFFDWTAEDRKAALALLTSAKLMQHRVHVRTTESDTCGITTGSRNAKSVYLSNEP